MEFFNAGKLRMMFQTIEACTGPLQELLREYSINQKPVDIKDITGRLLTDIMGSCIFGLDCNSLKDPHSEFRIYSHKVFQPNVADKIKAIFLLAFSPDFLKRIRLKVTNSRVEAFFMRIVREVIDYRESKKINRKDFIDLMIQLKNKGHLSQDEPLQGERTRSETESSETLTFNEIAAQCFVFFIAGFETSSSAVTSALLELALNQDIQNKLRKDIRTVLEKHDGKLTMEVVNNMKYLDKVVNGE